MKQEYAKFMRFGKKVKYRGKVFFLVDDANVEEATVKAVAEENLRRYDLLKAWSRNHVGVTPEQEEEMRDFEKELPVAKIEPDNTVRFITSHYETKFEVKDLSEVRFNGKLRTVVYLDEYHFAFADSVGAGVYGCYHICQFAELCKKNDWTVAPVAA